MLTSTARRQFTVPLDASAPGGLELLKGEIERLRVDAGLPEKREGWCEIADGGCDEPPATEGLLQRSGMLARVAFEAEKDAGDQRAVLLECIVWHDERIVGVLSGSRSGYFAAAKTVLLTTA